MDINLLTVSVGNSRTAVGAFVAGELTKVIRVTNSDPAALRAAVTDAWALLAGTERPAVAGASTNPPAVAAIDEAVEAVTGQTVQWVGTDFDLPIDVATDNPKATGVDRVLNVAAAYEQLGKACAVVDAGTALTLSFCDDKGRFLGGVIAPGAQLQLDALHARAPHLPHLKPEKPQGDFGKDTASALHHGVYHGLRGLVREVVENFASHLGTWPELIATGGDAELLFADSDLVHAISPDLTLYGLALAYTQHRLREDE